MDLEGIVSRLSDRFEVSPKYRQVGLEFLTDRLAWAVQHRMYRTLTEAVMEDELQYFYRMRGIIPIITVEGPRSVKFATDLHLFRASEVGVVDKERRHDAELFRLDRRTAERYRKGNGPSRGELIDQLGQTPQLRSYFHRSVSYDDVLPAKEVMQRYMTGQRAVTIQIGAKQIAMTPETPDDLWVLNPLFIKLRIGGTLTNEKLYYFWRRVESGKKGTEKDGTDGSEPWPALINHEGRQKGVVTYLGTAATWEAVASNSKAKFIKRGALPSRELVRLGVFTAMSTQKSRRGRRAKPTISEAGSEEPTGKSENTQSSPYGGRLVINYDVFGGYVPRDQLAAEVFRRRLLERLTRRPIYIGEAVALAEEVGFESKRGNGIDAQVRKILREWPSNMPKIVELINPNTPNIKNAPSYLGLEKYLGEKGEPVNRLLYGPLEQAVKEAHPEYSPKAVHQSAGIIIGMLEHSGVLTRGDLETLLESGNVGSIRSSSGRGLMSKDPRQRSYLNYFVTACEGAGYDVTKVKALVKEVAASSA